MVWTNTSRFYSRPITYVLTVVDNNNNNNNNKDNNINIELFPSATDNNNSNLPNISELNINSNII